MQLYCNYQNCFYVLLYYTTKTVNAVGYNVLLINNLKKLQYHIIKTNKITLN